MGIAVGLERAPVQVQTRVVLAVDHEPPFDVRQQLGEHYYKSSAYDFSTSEASFHATILTVHTRLQLFGYTKRPGPSLGKSAKQCRICAAALLDLLEFHSMLITPTEPFTRFL